AGRQQQESGEQEAARKGAQRATERKWGEAHEAGSRTAAAAAADRIFILPARPAEAKRRSAALTREKFPRWDFAAGVTGTRMPARTQSWTPSRSSSASLSRARVSGSL